jgi:hypothetical protein
LRQLGTADAPILIGIDQRKPLRYTAQRLRFVTTQHSITVHIGVTKAIGDMNIAATTASR